MSYEDRKCQEQTTEEGSYIDVDHGMKLHYTTLCYNMFLIFFFITRTTPLMCVSQLLFSLIEALLTAQKYIWRAAAVSGQVLCSWIFR